MEYRRIPSTTTNMNAVMASTKTDKLRIDSAGGEAGSKIETFCQDAAYPYLEELAKRLAVTQRAHHPQVVVDERLRRPTVQNSKDVPRKHLGLSQGMLGQVGVGLAVGRWNERTIPEGPHLRVALATHGPIHHHVSALVLLYGQAGHDRVGNNPRSQDDGLRFNRFFGQVDLTGLDRPHDGLGPDSRPVPLAEHARSIICQRRVDFRH